LRQNQWAKLVAGFCVPSWKNRKELLCLATILWSAPPTIRLTIRTVYIFRTIRRQGNMGIVSREN
jgi:hypothetical protein